MARVMPSRRARTKPLIRVRRARLSDLDALMALEERVFATDRMSRQSLRRLITAPSARVLVAESEGRFAGSAVVLFRNSTTVARLYSIAVVPTMSGKGVAVALLATIERAARAHGCRCLRLEVHEANAAAITRYRKSGYRQFGRYPRYYEDGGDALRFDKPIGSRGSRVSSR
jgi:ribosomal-protein-alanine N-acetyltransferase